MLKFSKVIAFSFAFILGFLTLASGSATAQATPPEKVQVGAYLMRLNNVSQKDGTFDVDMWLWFRWKDAAIKPYATFEISNGRIDSRSEVSTQMDGDMNYATVRVRGTVFHDYNVKNYPMDDHNLTISLEDEAADNTRIVYEVDKNTAIDPGLNVPGWAIKLAPQTVVDHRYPTNYGLVSSGVDAATYSQANFNVELHREGYAPLFKQFWIAGLSVLLGLMAFRVKATDLDARFGLGVGSIFAASANAFVIADSLPQSAHVTLAEQINFLAIGTIFLCVAISIWSLRICYQGKDELSAKLDDWAMVIIASLYVLINFVIVLFHI